MSPPHLVQLHSKFCVTWLCGTDHLLESLSISATLLAGSLIFLRLSSLPVIFRGGKAPLHWCTQWWRPWQSLHSIRHVQIMVKKPQSVCFTSQSIGEIDEFFSVGTVLISFQTGAKNTQKQTGQLLSLQKRFRSWFFIFLVLKHATLTP